MLINFLSDQLILGGNGLIFPSQDKDSLLRKVSTKQMWKQSHVKFCTTYVLLESILSYSMCELHTIFTETAQGNLWKCFFLPLVVLRSDYQPGHGLCCQSYHELSAWVTKRSWGMNGLIFPSQHKDSRSRTCNRRKCFFILAPNNCDRWTNKYAKLVSECTSVRTSHRFIVF